MRKGNREKFPPVICVLTDAIMQSVVFITGAIGAKFPGMNHLVEGVVDTTVSAGERLAYAVFDDSMSWDEKWAYAFDPGQMVADFVTGVVIGEILDGIMASNTE